MLAPKCSTYNGRPTFANPRYLKKAQSEKPCLYEIPYDNSDSANRFSPDRKETMTLANESRSKLNKDYVKRYDYTRQNSLYEIFKAPSLEYLSVERANKKLGRQCGENRLLEQNQTLLKTLPFYLFRNPLVKDLKAQMQDKNIAISEVKRNSIDNAKESLYLNDVNARTKKPKVVPISASKPKRKANKSVATPHKKTVASDTTIQKSKRYKWTQNPLRTKKIWMPKIRKEDVSTSISPTIDIYSRITNIVQLILFIVDSGCTMEMMFDRSSSSLSSQCQMVSAENNTSGPVPQC
ncbi:hypothetical protein Tco_1113047 [Tanacetum coccineum]|uniref:Uncharacterized protein n=1 Tax=Tanacetum coccineum TaxID=301880 RepID=A0ABQ5IRA3_9ASTR